MRSDHAKKVNKFLRRMVTVMLCICITAPLMFVAPAEVHAADADGQKIEYVWKRVNNLSELNEAYRQYERAIGTGSTTAQKQLYKDAGMGDGYMKVMFMDRDLSRFTDGSGFSGDDISTTTTASRAYWGVNPKQAGGFQTPMDVVTPFSIKREADGSGGRVNYNIKLGNGKDLWLDYAFFVVGCNAWFDDGPCEALMRKDTHIAYFENYGTNTFRIGYDLSNVDDIYWSFKDGKVVNTWDSKKDKNKIAIFYATPVSVAVRNEDFVIDADSTEVWADKMEVNSIVYVEGSLLINSRITLNGCIVVLGQGQLLLGSDAVVGALDYDKRGEIYELKPKAASPPNISYPTDLFKHGSIYCIDDSSFVMDKGSIFCGYNTWSELTLKDNASAYVNGTLCIGGRVCQTDNRRFSNYSDDSGHSNLTFGPDAYWYMGYTPKNENTISAIRKGGAPDTNCSSSVGSNMISYLTYGPNFVLWGPDYPIAVTLSDGTRLFSQKVPAAYGQLFMASGTETYIYQYRGVDVAPYNLFSDFSPLSFDYGVTITDYSK